MIQIVKSILGSCDIEFNNELQIILSDENKNILSPDELDVFKYLSKEFENNKQFPTQAIFLTKFPQYRQQLDEFQALSIIDLRYYRKQFITKHQNIFKSRMLHKMASEAAVMVLHQRWQNKFASKQHLMIHLIMSNSYHSVIDTQKV